MEQLNTLYDLFESELLDALSAQQQLIDALPDMIQAASSNEVKSRLSQHLQQAQEQVQRLEDIFEELAMDVEIEKCMGMAGILEDGQKIVSSNAQAAVKDAALITAIQKAEHYQIATYTTLRRYAQALGEHEVAEILTNTLREDVETDEMLTGIATGSVNIKAAEPDRRSR